jgi:hypothetical protein
MAYSEEDLVTIQTKDHGEVLYFRSLLKERFGLCRDYFDSFPESDTISLDLSHRAITFILRIFDLCLEPENKETWIKCLTILDYLRINTRWFHLNIHKNLDSFLTRKGLANEQDLPEDIPGYLRLLKS